MYITPVFGHKCIRTYPFETFSCWIFPSSLQLMEIQITCLLYLIFFLFLWIEIILYYTTEMKTTEGSSQNGLGLSLGLNRGSGRWHGCSKSSGFTFLQLRELEHQALIYNYIEAGIPVPFHLILPVWKSVASSFTGLNGEFPNTHGHSSFLYSKWLRHKRPGTHTQMRSKPSNPMFEVHMHRTASDHLCP